MVQLSKEPACAERNAVGSRLIFAKAVVIRALGLLTGRLGFLRWAHFSYPSSRSPDAALARLP
jgi:hypothetical protein